MCLNIDGVSRFSVLRYRHPSWTSGLILPTGLRHPPKDGDQPNQKMEISLSSGCIGTSAGSGFGVSSFGTLVLR